jgi:hexosaminidase
VKLAAASTVLFAAAFAACYRPVTGPSPANRRNAPAVIPAPVTLAVASRDSFLITPRTGVYVDSTAGAEVQAVGDYAANLLASQAGVTARRVAPGAVLPDSSIRLTLDSSRTDLGLEGYELTATTTQVRIVAARPAGLFYGVQTLRQLLPASVEHQAARGRRLIMPAVHVVDHPRYAWRGAMLDVSRHFLPPADVKRFIDAIALYKMNRLHLHLSDDQGWRIEIKAWPDLTTVGGQTAVGGAPGGFYTQEQYADLVAFARSRYVTVVPEIDMPGHINAALVSYPELTCNGVAPPPFTAVGGPPNSLCVSKDTIYSFIDDVVREIAAAAPTPYFHIGGDEVRNLTQEQYRGFVSRVEQIVTAAGPRMIGWSEIAPVNLSPNTIVQHWHADSVQLHAQRGGKVIMSPAAHAYIDQKYDSSTILGLAWAGMVTLRRAYEWDPAAQIPGVGESSILGVEGPLWAETLLTRADYEYMAFPRLAALAEVGWTPSTLINWESFRRRIGEEGERLQALGVNFARVPGVDWHAK